MILGMAVYAEDGPPVLVSAAAATEAAATTTKVYAEWAAEKKTMELIELVSGPGLQLKTP